MLYKYIMSDWTYDGKLVDLETVDKYHGFVYVIENEITGKKYIGKKKFKFTRAKKLKGQRKIRVSKESDWRSYFGSCKELVADVQALGPENFKRTILRFCKSPGENTYWEMWHQMTNHVLLHPADWYNNYVGGRIQRSHVLKKEK